MAVAKTTEVETGTLLISPTASLGMSNNSVVNEMKFTNVVNSHEYMKLIL